MMRLEREDDSLLFASLNPPERFMFTKLPSDKKEMKRKLNCERKSDTRVHRL